MVILHYIPTLSPKDGGTATYMQQLSDALGQKVIIHIVTHRTAEQLPVRHAHLHYLSSGWNINKIYKEFKIILDTIRPDIVHVNCCWRPIFALISIWAKRAGYRVVFTPHGMLEPWIIKNHYFSRKIPALLLYQRKALDCADCVLATSENELKNIEILSTQFFLFKSWHPEIKMIPNGIDVDKIKIRDGWNNSCKLLFLSRIHPKKGLDNLLYALSLLLHKKNITEKIILTIAGEGDGKYISYLKKLSKDLGIEKDVRWLGGIYGDEKWQLLKDADLLVLPSHSENFGMVVGESLASGTPVLTTTKTPWSVINICACGWCVDDKIESIEEALCQFICTDTETRRKMGIRGRNLIEKKYSSSFEAEQYVDLYNQICFSHTR